MQPWSSRRACAAVLLLSSVACGGPDSTSSDEADITLEHVSPHLNPLLADGEARPKPGKLVYYGGPVLSHPRVVAVLWGAVDPAVGDHLGAFYAALLASPHFTWLSEYNTPTQTISKGSFGGVVHLMPKNAHKTLTDAQVEKELAAQIAAGKLPRPDADTVFMVHFPPGVLISSDGARSCQSGGFCGYHSAVKIRGQRLAYSVLPDMGPGSGCDTGCGPGSALDRVTMVSSHELAEVATDPEVGLAKALAAPLAWYNEAGGEIADLCEGQTARVKMGSATWTVQKLWSNAAKACISGK